MPTSYILIAGLAAAVGAIGFVVSKMRKTPNVDQVTQSVLNRIRTEYR